MQGERQIKKILQINFKVKAVTPELMQAFGSMAPRFGPNGDVKGLQWKIWLMNEAEKSAGGIYLFKDDASVQTYLKSEIIKGVKSNPAVYGFEAKIFDIVPEPTKISRGPVD